MVLLKLYLLKDWSRQWHHGIETVVYEAGLKLCDYDYVSRETSFNNGSSMLFARGGGGGTPIHYLYGYVPPNGVVILKLLI